jgi:hypothetical protein
MENPLYGHPKKGEVKFERDGQEQLDHLEGNRPSLSTEPSRDTIRAVRRIQYSKRPRYRYLNDRTIPTTHPPNFFARRQTGTHTTP